MLGGIYICLDPLSILETIAAFSTAFHNHQPDSCHCYVLVPCQIQEGTEQDAYPSWILEFKSSWTKVVGLDIQSWVIYLCCLTRYICLPIKDLQCDITAWLFSMVTVPVADRWMHFPAAMNPIAKNARNLLVGTDTRDHNIQSKNTQEKSYWDLLMMRPNESPSHPMTAQVPSSGHPQAHSCLSTSEYISNFDS